MCLSLSRSALANLGNCPGRPESIHNAGVPLGCSLLSLEILASVNHSFFCGALLPSFLFTLLGVNVEYLCHYFCRKSWEHRIAKVLPGSERRGCTRWGLGWFSSLRLAPKLSLSLKSQSKATVREESTLHVHLNRFLFLWVDLSQPGFRIWISFICPYATSFILFLRCPPSSVKSLKLNFGRHFYPSSQEQQMNTGSNSLFSF